MKKLFVIILVVISLLLLCSCSKQQCWSCKKDISNDASFCEYCGASVDGEVMQRYIGIWEDVDDGTYMYVYENGTGDRYGSSISPHSHYNNFTWELEGKYFVYKTSDAFGGDWIEKYTLDDDCLLDGQGKIAFHKYSDDPTVDL